MQATNMAVSNTFTTDAAAALLSSSAYTFMFYPIHRVKVLLQTQDGIPEVKTGQIQRYRFQNSFQRIISEQGWRSLWRGCTPYMMRHVPSTTLSFAFKDMIQRILPEPDPQSQSQMYAVSRLVAGGIAGVLALAVVYPLDLSTIRMAASTSNKDPSLRETIAGSTQRGGGINALYKGYGISALAIGGYKALYFGLYDIAKEYMLQRPEPAKAIAQLDSGNTTSRGSYAEANVQSSSSDSNLRSIASKTFTTISSSSSSSDCESSSNSSSSDDDGMSSMELLMMNDHLTEQQQRKRAGLIGHLFKSWVVASSVVYIASTITYPLDVVRKRWVLDSGLPPDKRHFNSAWHCFKTILRQEGLRGLYRFYGYDMVLRFGGGILLVMYDEVRGGIHHIKKSAGNVDALPT